MTDYKYADHMITLCLSIARTAHMNSYRRDGVTEYFTHPDAVANSLSAKQYDYKYICTAYLHDVLEDTNLTAQELIYLGVDADIVEAVIAITKTKGESYENYLTKVKANKIATVVKIEDMKHNLSDSPTERQVEKYTKALKYLGA